MWTGGRSHPGPFTDRLLACLCGADLDVLNNDSSLSVRTLSRTGAPARAIPAARRRRASHALTHAMLTWPLHMAVTHGRYTWPLHMAMAWRSVTLIHDMHQRPRSTVRGARTQWASPGAFNTAASGFRGSDGQAARRATDACSSSPARARDCAPWQSQAARKALRRRPSSNCTRG